MVLPKDAAIEGAFMMEGLLDTPVEELCSAYGEGFLSLVEELCHYAPVVWAMAEAGGDMAGDFPGVYDYEVTSPFGSWFGKYLVTHGHIPDEKTVEDWLVNTVHDFFTQGEGVPAPVALWNELLVTFRENLHG